MDRIDRIIYECVEEDTRSIAKIGVGGNVWRLDMMDRMANEHRWTG
jgi:hypothetical protein